MDPLSPSLIAPTSGALRKPRALSRTRRAETLTAWVLILPALIGFLVFYAWPTLRAIEMNDRSRPSL